MKVIHLLRKPCSESTVAANVLRWGTGALNVDATRVRTSDSLDGGATSRTSADQKGNEGWTRPWMEDPIAQEAHAERVRANVAKAEALGRWPANLVLQHLPECEQTGTREEAGYSVNRFTDGAKPFGGGAGHSYESVTVPPSTVAVWSCAHGCPVAALDRQSGQSTTPTKVMRGAGGQHGVYGSFGAQSDIPSYGDAGGASRFFKQFGG